MYSLSIASLYASSDHGRKVNLVNPAYETARELKALLERDGLNNDGKQSYEGAMHEFYVSDAANKF